MPPKKSKKGKKKVLISGNSLENALANNLLNKMGMDTSVDQSFETGATGEEETSILNETPRSNVNDSNIESESGSLT